MRFLFAAVAASVVCLASAEVVITVDPSDTKTTVTVDVAKPKCAQSALSTHNGEPDVDGPLGFVNTVSYKSDADAAHWIAYVDEWAPMAKKIGMLELKAVQTSGSTGYFVGVFPNNEAHYAWDAYMATDENIPKMFATISHMDVKLWGALSHKTREIIARWDSMPQLAVTATEAAIASAGRPDPAQANQQIVNVAFPTAEGLQEMIDAFLSPNIWNMIESSGSTWVFFRTGATTGLIYQSEPSPQAVADTIGNADFGAKLGPIVGKMVRGGGIVVLLILLLDSLDSSPCALSLLLSPAVLLYLCHSLRPP